MEKFQDCDPLPIYEVPTEQLGYGNRILVKFRELVFGQEGGAEYTALPFPKIRVSKELNEEIKDDVVKHEVNHHLDRTRSEPDKYDIRFAAIVIPAFIVTLWSVHLSGLLRYVLSSVGPTVLIVYPLYHLFVVDENKADQGTIFEDRDLSFKNLATYPVALAATPFKILSLVEEFWMERPRIFTAVRDSFSKIEWQKVISESA
ncbi:hypothetical protein [Haloplanus natans]|uniref:hypothetical protein n=1 Tax=Haloplanus natans TaxID=376171 RepID=UPI000677A85B|nr:hypothetical protein [Haloplanus natans]